MSLITAHFDVSGVSFLIKKDKKSTEILNFPYVYSKGLFSNQCDESDFYSKLLEKIMIDRGIKPSTCNIVTCGFIEPPNLNIKTKLSVGVVDLIEKADEIIPVFVNNSALITKGYISSKSDIREYVGAEKSESDFGEFNDIANAAIFPQLVPSDVSSQISVDTEVYGRIPKNLKFESGRKIIFTGGRFSQNILDKELNYILALDMLRGLGVFNIYLDTSNFFSLYRATQLYDKEMVGDLFEYIEDSGLFIRTGGACECLLSTGVGDDKFIEIEENKVFVLPLKVENPAKVSIKSRDLGTIDLRATGGRIGLVFDTRASGSGSIYSDVKLFNDCIKQFESVLKGN
jgi:hypothetical protein